jgi:hypothetical protein
MKKALLFPLLASLLLLGAGCSDDDKKPTTPNGHDNTASTVWDAAGGYWRTTVNATDYEEYAGYSFAVKDTVPPAAGDGWDAAFRREAIKLNGGSSGDGSLEGADLGVLDYAGVDEGDTLSAQWTSDSVDYLIDAWYSYNPQTHQLDMTRNVYTMQDASGNHFVKFSVDSLSGELSQTSMGDVHLTYYYQSSAGDRSLPGPTQTAIVHVGSGAGYFDFSSGSEVSPGNPATSLDWDIRFQNYSIAQNSGPSGSGQCAAFPAYQEMADPTDIGSLTEQPAGAPLFPDVPGSVLTNWYDYNDQTHQLSSKNHVYLVRSGDGLYKMKILGYYVDQGGVPVSAVYTFIWNEL